ncbi:MAG: flagellar basal body-associated FliL family protein [Deltaproteobacteria bacterium]|nr:flagellar basal body-associated FliL family protein [Deltaproteobacteria bacterium]
MSQTEEQGKEEKAAPMSTAKMMIFIGVAVLVNAGIIVGALTFTLNKGGGHPAAEGGHDKKGGEAAKAAAPVIYPLEPFIVNIRDGRDMRYLKIKLEFETNAGAEVKTVLAPYLAPMRDAILVLLTTKNFQELQDLAGKNRLREEILALAAKIAPAGKISRVFFTDFVVQ